MSEQDTLTLKPAQHDKLGIVHCGVTRPGVVACAGELKDIEDGEEVRIDRAGIQVKRSGDEYTFSRAH
ncbi:hypothetical protein [Thiohalobacter thiocyanaticus]|uniref:Uncharacterized protein n=1 Tax=Thiohalobacter thiocyanaticus TaxID=585455 RepID=A0A426QGV7_9GAMM|nr:hypothetical protein [Thiohalobacter thiocyanaticus]RRQ20989.1 hypothetical protein D6C00_02715 [Thiohalobacter thiocyanaticus]